MCGCSSAIQRFIDTDMRCHPAAHYSLPCDAVATLLVVLGLGRRELIEVLGL